MLFTCGCTCFCASHVPSVFGIPHSCSAERSSSRCTAEASSGVTRWLFVHMRVHMGNLSLVEELVLFQKLHWKPVSAPPAAHQWPSGSVCGPSADLSWSVMSLFDAAAEQVFTIYRYDLWPLGHPEAEFPVVVGYRRQQWWHLRNRLLIQKELRDAGIQFHSPTEQHFCGAPRGRFDVKDAV